jgi:hypothetical protein
VSDGARRAYRSYWNRVVQAWGERRDDEPHPSEIEQLRNEKRRRAYEQRSTTYTINLRAAGRTERAHS